MKQTHADTLALPPASAKKFTLENGLTVILKVDRSAPVISARPG